MQSAYAVQVHEIAEDLSLSKGPHATTEKARTIETTEKLREDHVGLARCVLPMRISKNKALGRSFSTSLEAVKLFLPAKSL